MGYYYVIRRRLDDSLIEESEEDFDTYGEADQAGDESLFLYASGADALEGSGRDYIEEDDMYVEILER